MAAKKTKGTANLPANWDEELAKYAQEASAAEVGGGSSRVSFRGGRFTLGGEVIGDGTKLQVVVVNAAYENAYYEEDFDPNNPTSPSCYAVAMKHDELGPDDAVKAKQSEDGTCAGCWANAFNSGKGRGKACKNGRRLALVSAASEKQLEAIVDGSAQLFMLTLPPTSLKFWAGYVKGLEAIDAWPYWMAVTTFTLEPGAQSTLIPVPQEVGRLDPPRYLNALKALRQRAEPSLLDTSLFEMERAPAAEQKKKPARGKGVKGVATAKRGKRF